MTLPIPEAKSIMRLRLGRPVKDVKYVFGFHTADGRALALHPEQQEARLWYQPPAAPDIPGVRRIATAKNDDLNGPMSMLAGPQTQRVELEDAAALHRFLDWYTSVEELDAAAGQAAVDLRPANFTASFARFQDLMRARSGRSFVSFDEGQIASWEDYKPRLRVHALSLLRIEDWTEGEVGSGAILRRLIDAIEIQDSRSTLTNNLVFWQNRFGHANRDHRALLEARTNPRTRMAFEQLLYGLFRGRADEGSTFDRLSALTGAKYPLLAYLYFLKDMDRFMPIQPTGFDRVFGALGVQFSTLRQCNWENYKTFTAVLQSLRPLLREAAGLSEVSLVDAHSFCWAFTTLIKEEAQGLLNVGSSRPRNTDGRVVGGRERSLLEMRLTVEDTVRNSNGQTVERTIKNKELMMSVGELDALIVELMQVQEDKCALTGIPFHFHGQGADKNLLPSLDRKDSDGHYERDNLQVVCRFINFWKGDSDNAEFQRLLMLVRGYEG